MNNNNMGELGWDDAIENESPEFVVLPEGDYDFEVTKFERGRHGGSDKLPPCNKAIVHIKIESDLGVTIIQNNFFLHSKTEGLICAFFTAIGLRKHGERFVMDWPATVGTRGRAKVGTRKWTNEGREYISNEIRKFYEPEDAPQQASSSKPAFRPGTF